MSKSSLSTAEQTTHAVLGDAAGFNCQASVRQRHLEQKEAGEKTAKKQKWIMPTQLTGA